MAWERPTIFHAARVAGAALVITAGIALVGYVLVQLAVLSLALFVAVLLTCLLWPVARLLERWKVPRTLSSVLAVFLLLGVAGGAMTWIVPTALAELAANRDELLANARRGVESLQRRLPGGLKPFDGVLEQIPSYLQANTRRVIAGVASSVVTATELVGGLLLALILTIFFLRDGRELARKTLDHLSPSKRDAFEPALANAWTSLRAWIRGAAIVALVDAVAIGVGLAVLGVPLVLPLALLTFFSAFIPVVGATVAGILAVLVAGASGGATDALITLAIVVAVQQLEGNVLQPLVMGRSVPLHPAVVLIVVTAGTLLGGIGGAFIAVPLAGATSAFFFELGRRSVPAGAGGRGEGEDEAQRRQSDEARALMLQQSGGGAATPGPRPH